MDFDDLPPHPIDYFLNKSNLIIKLFNSISYFNQHKFLQNYNNYVLIQFILEFSISSYDIILSEIIHNRLIIHEIELIFEEIYNKLLLIST